MPDAEKSPYPEYPQADGVYRDGMPDPVFKKYLSIMRRHMWPALTLMVVVSSMGLIRAYKAAPVYEASVKILVERQTPRVMRFEDVIQPNAAWWGQEYYRTQEELVRSRAVLELALEEPAIRAIFEYQPGAPTSPSLSTLIRRTIAAVLGTPPVTPAEPWERLQASVQARHANETQFITVYAFSGNAQRAADIANAVAKAFVRYHMLRRMEVSNDVFLYIEDQKNKEERALRESEERLQAFREETRISSLETSDSEHPVVKRLGLLNDELTETQLQRIELEAQSRVIRSVLDSKNLSVSAAGESLFSIPAVKADATIDQLRTSLVATEGERGTLAEVYGPEHPRMQAILARMTTLQEKLKSALDSVGASLAAQEQMLRDKERALSEQYEEQNRLALGLARESLAYQRILNEVNRHQKLYEVLVERMREVELSSDYTRTNVEIVEQASLPKAPSAPNKPRMAMMSLFMALLLGIGLAFLLEHADDTVRTPDDLEIRVGVPVLGFVPEISARKDVESKTAYRAIVSALEPSSSIIEAYRNIRTSLFFAGPAEECRVLLITSGGPGDGKTTTACNLALVIAQSGKRVLLVDGDFRRPMIHKNFNLDNTQGLSNVLVGECTLEQAVQKSVHDVNIIENLDILTAGPTPPNPTELMESPAMRKLMNEFRGQYDRIIVDTPPVLFVSDASILSSTSDGVILVVRANRHTRAHAIRARKQLQKVNGRIVGGILNHVRVPKFGHHYSDFYYHGYARYRSDYYSAYYSGDGSDTRADTKSSMKR